MKLVNIILQRYSLLVYFTMTEFAAGSWNMVDTKNFDEYMKAIGKYESFSVLIYLVVICCWLLVLQRVPGHVQTDHTCQVYYYGTADSNLYIYRIYWHL